MAAITGTETKLKAIGWNAARISTALPPGTKRAAARHPTERYYHDGFAFEVQRYQDLAGAWNCFFEDVRLELPAGSSTKPLPPVFA